MDVQTAAGLFEQAMDDGQAQAGALARRLGGEIGLKYLGQHFRRDAGAVVADGNQCSKGRRVGEALAVENAVVRAVVKMGESTPRFQDLAGNINEVRLGGALQGVDGEVEQDLDEVGAVDLQFDVLGPRRGFSGVLLAFAGMDVEQFAQIVQNLVDVDADGGAAAAGA